MKDLTDARLIKLKGFLFLVMGIASALLLILEHPTFKMGLLLALTIWCFCRAYYFAFHVVQHWLAPGFRFTGLGHFARFWWRRHRARDR